MAVEEIWRYQDGPDMASDSIYGAAVFSDDSFVVGGSSRGAWTGSNTGDQDFVAVKIAPNGTVLWVWQEGSSAEDVIRAVVALDDDSVIIAGYLRGSWNGVTAFGVTDFVAVKLHSNGTMLWSWQEGTDAYDYILSAAATADGNVVLAGYTYGSWNRTHDGFYEVAVVKLDPDGTVLWRWQIGTGGTGGVYIRASAARPDGSVVLAGYTHGIWHGEIDPGEDPSFMAVALDEGGGELWRWQAGSDGVDVLLAATALANGSVVLAGYTTGNWSGSNVGKDFAAVKLDVNGMEEWRWQDGTDEDDEWVTATLGRDGSTILAGYTEGSWSTENKGGSDMAALSLDTGGAQALWSYQEGTTEDDDINAATVTTDGAVFLAGWTDGSWTIPASDGNADFAAVLLDTGSPAITPSPAMLDPAITPSPATLIPAITPQPTTLKPATTPSPATLKPAITPQPTTLEPAISPQPTTLEPGTIQPSLVPPLASSNAPVVPSASSSGSSAALDPRIVGAVAAVAAALALTGVCIYRRRNATGTVAIPVTTEQEHVCYPLAVTVNTRQEHVCYPQAVTVTPQQEHVCYPQAVTVNTGQEHVCYPQALTVTPQQEHVCYPQAVTPPPDCRRRHAPSLRRRVHRDCDDM